MKKIHMCIAALLTQFIVHSQPVLACPADTADTITVCGSPTYGAGGRYDGMGGGGMSAAEAYSKNEAASRDAEWARTQKLKKEAEEAAKKKKAEDCKNKAATIANADAAAKRCVANETSATSVTKSSCSPVTKMSMSYGNSWGANADIDLVLKAFNISAGAVMSRSVSGTLEWNPHEDCFIKQDVLLAAKSGQCNLVVSDATASMANCPK